MQVTPKEGREGALWTPKGRVSRQREQPVQRPRGSMSSGTEDASMAGRVSEVEQVGEEVR